MKLRAILVKPCAGGVWSTMKLKRVSRLIAAGMLCGAITSLSAPPSAAGTWDFSVCNGSTTSPGTASGTVTNPGTANNSYACAANGSTTRDLTASAWGAISSTNNSYGTALVSNQGIDGFGVGAQSEGGAAAVSPNNALDNDPTSLAPNLIVLRFSSAVVLDRVTLGWSMNDADLTIMAYNGAGTPSTFIGGKDASTLTAGGASAGWSLVQNVGDAAPDTAYAASGSNITYDVNGSGVSSSYWLISAYDSGFGAGTLDTLVDYAKLLSVTTRAATEVAEPTTLALLGLGLAGLAASRRRKQ